MSDLHLDLLIERKRDKFINSLNGTGIDVLVLAGDIVEGRASLKGMRRDIWERICDRYVKVIATLGNHDNWKTNAGEAQEEILSYNIPNLSLLTNNSVVYKDRTFRGGTLWYQDCKDWAGGYAEYKKKVWCDYSEIWDAEPWIYEQNEEFRGNVCKNIQEGDIIVSHMLPSIECIHPMFRGSDYNDFFISDCKQDIIEKKPVVWFFGHTHCPFDFVLGNTRMYSNPLGYGGEGMNPYFSDRSFVEL
jgi:hypothetical protein